MAKTIATVLGVGFLLVGILGFLAPGMLGMHLSATHNLVHLVSGAVSLYFGLAGTLAAARLFDLAFGAVYGLLGVLGFLLGSQGAPHGVPGPPDARLWSVIPGVFEVGTSDHVVHILLGLLFLVGGLLTRPGVRTTSD
jgi:hypothetical protein